MQTNTFTRRNETVSLPVRTLDRLSARAALRGQSLQAYLEEALEALATAPEAPAKPESPSPGGDPWFDDPENVACVKEAWEESKFHPEQGTFMKPEETLSEFLDRVKA